MQSVWVVRSIAAAAFSLLAGTAAPAHATVINYVTNGSFETYSVLNNVTSFGGWAVSTGSGASNPGYGPESATTDSVTKNRFGDIVVPDNATSPSPDAAGTHALYFVDDVAYQSVTQQVYLPAAGVYEVGFDAMNTTSGSGNKYDSTVVALMAGVTVVSGNTTIFGTNSWTHFSANATVSTPGYYAVQFAFQGGSAPAKDVFIDKVYVNNPSVLPGGGVIIPAIPEPWTLPLLASGLAGLAALRRRAAR
jgi:hypothetical protein